MIRLVLEEDVPGGGCWGLRARPGFGASTEVRARRFPTKETAEAHMVVMNSGLYPSGKGWTEWLEVYEVVASASTRTEVMSWPARGDFDAWVAGRRLGTEPEKKPGRTRRKRGTVAPTGVPSAPSTTLGEEAGGAFSKGQSAVLQEHEDQLNRIIRAAFERYAVKAKERGMYQEIKT